MQNSQAVKKVWVHANGQGEKVTKSDKEFLWR